MKPIEGYALSQKCDYSFGDQSGQWGNIHTSFMKPANLLNLEFVDKVFSISKERDYMTLFIDNIRLYKRNCIECNDSDRLYVDRLMNESDLLSLCSNFPDMRFIIFTNLEDTPIDEAIHNLIPDNVLLISAVNAVSNGGKVVPAPYGLQRAMHPGDDRCKVISEMIDQSPEKNHLCYVSFNESSHPERKGLKQLFSSFAKVDYDRVNYDTFLDTLQRSKFVICPRGNAIDCHRNWEAIYLRTVPIMKKNDYLETLFKDYPVLFVNEWSDVTENLLTVNDHLVMELKELPLHNLDLDRFYSHNVNHALEKE